MKSKSQQRREKVIKTGKLPVLPKNWGKVKGTTAFDPPVKPVKWKPEGIEKRYAVMAVFKDSYNLDHYKYFTFFRTRALAEKALKKIKQVLKDSQHS